jgi:WD40 repeat protein
MSASEDGSIRRWTRNGKPVGKPWHSDGGSVGSIAVSPDETMAVSGSIDGRLRLWNIKEDRVVGDPLEGHKDVVRCLDWSPNGLEIASGSEDGAVRRWIPDTGRQIGPTIETSHEWVNAIKYSPQSDKIATGGHDNMIRVWSKDGELLIQMKGHDNRVNSLCWSKDGAYIFSGSSDRTIRKWQLIDGKEAFVLQGHTQPVTSICVSPDESHLVSASYDYSVRIWDLKTNQQVGDPLLHDDQLLTVVLSSDGRYIASAGLDKKIYIWSLEAALKQAGDQVRAHIAISLARSLISNRLCVMAMHSPTRSSRQVILACLSPCISILHQGRATSPRDVRQFAVNNLIHSYTSLGL